MFMKKVRDIRTVISKVTWKWILRIRLTGLIHSLIKSLTKYLFSRVRRKIETKNSHARITSIQSGVEKIEDNAITKDHICFHLAMRTQGPIRLEK